MDKANEALEQLELLEPDRLEADAASNAFNDVRNAINGDQQPADGHQEPLPTPTLEGTNATNHATNHATNQATKQPSKSRGIVPPRTPRRRCPAPTHLASEPRPRPSHSAARCTGG